MLLEFLIDFQEDILEVFSGLLLPKTQQYGMQTVDTMKPCIVARKPADANLSIGSPVHGSWFSRGAVDVGEHLVRVSKT